MSVLSWIGIGLGVLSVAGLGGLFISGYETLAVTSAALGVISAGTGLAGAGLDLPGCIKTHGEACYGLALGGFGAISGIGAAWGSFAVLRGAGAFTARNTIL